MSRIQPGNLYLVPVTLGSSDPNSVIAEPALAIVRELQNFIAENAKSARQFMKQVEMAHPFSEIEVLEIDKHSGSIDFGYYFHKLRSGTDTGLLSEAGMPGIADPGAAFVKQAHAENIRVIPLTGPSSIFLALSASGLNGQGFCFHGYLPKDKSERISKIKAMETVAKKQLQTQIFIETPYRNHQILNDLLASCSPDTLLCVAAEITLPGEMIKTKPISEWKKATINLDKKPAVFLLL